jgi:hypothetical protein
MRWNKTVSRNYTATSVDGTIYTIVGVRHDSWALFLGDVLTFSGHTMRELKGTVRRREQRITHNT